MKNIAQIKQLYLGHFHVFGKYLAELVTLIITTYVSKTSFFVVFLQMCCSHIV